MHIPNTNASEQDRVCAELRRLVALRERQLLTDRRGRLSQFTRSCASVGSERLAELLDRRSALFVAACLSLLLMPFVYFYGPQTQAIAPSEVESLSASRDVEATLSDIEDAAEDETLADDYALSAPRAGGAFAVRVGAFRNPLNAKRVAGLLRKQTLDVQTRVRANGLHVVMLGPFTTRATAEQAAHSVKETLGLTSLILRRVSQ